MDHGKSYFVKLHIMRQYLTGKYQYIFDIDNEYVELLKKIGGEEIENNINIFHIYEFDVKENMINFKADEIIDIITRIINLTQSQKLELTNSIISTYNEFGITNEINSIYEDKMGEIIYLNKKLKNKFPKFDDVILKLKGKLKTKIRNIVSEYKYLNCTTKANIYNEVLIFNIFNKNPMVTEYYINLVKKLIKYNKKKSLIYFDEVWKIIGLSDSIKDNIFEFYKTIRKENSGIITITQEIGDIFNDKNNGRSILNNSNIKLFFNIEYIESNIFSNLSIFENKDLKKLSVLEKGCCLLLIQNNVLNVKIKSTQYEDNLIRGNVE